MKKIKKILVLLLSVSMVFGLAACGSGSNSGDLYPAEKVKIGVVTFDSSGDQFIALQNYFDYLSEDLNIEFVYSESINNAEAELSFIESSAAAGCKAIIGYYNIARAEAIQLAIDKGMYYFGVAEENAVYEKFKDNSMYLGGYFLGSADEDSGYEMGKALAEAGCEKVIYSAGGRDFGIQMFIDRSIGFYRAIDEAIAAGKTIEVVDVSGFPGTDVFSSKQTAALAEEGVDGLASAFGAGVWLQPLETSGKTANIKIATSDSISDIYSEGFENGTVVCLAAQPLEIFGLAVPMIINSLDGNSDVVRENGQAPRVSVDNWYITNADDYNTILTMETDGTWAVNVDEIKSTIKGLNSDTTFETLISLYGDLSPDTIAGRR